MTNRLPNRKLSTRLKFFSYKGPYAYSVTICTCEKSPIFKIPKAVKTILDLLKEISTRYGFRLVAYCFMPDHLHLLVAGDKDSNLLKFIQTFKQVSSCRFRKNFGERLWQRGYYEHVLRAEENLEKVARYIWGNPVRKGLVEHEEEYPFSGPEVIL
ncbi:hypothetical protein ES703_86866 [subsurface metagenome]|nr:transposase [bacterium]